MIMVSQVGTLATLSSICILACFVSSGFSGISWNVEKAREHRAMPCMRTCIPGVGAKGLSAVSASQKPWLSQECFKQIRLLALPFVPHVWLLIESAASDEVPQSSRHSSLPEMTTHRRL